MEKLLGGRFNAALMGSVEWDRLPPIRVIEFLGPGRLAVIDKDAIQAETGTKYSRRSQDRSSRKAGWRRLIPPIGGIG